jgi:hypothetical protein
MKINSHPVVVYTTDPKTRHKVVVEVTNLLAVPATFYEYEESEFSDQPSDEVAPEQGFLTLIGGRTYRLHSIPPERVTEQAGGINPVLEVLVPVDQIEGYKAPPAPSNGEAAPPEMKPDELG